MQDKYLAFMEIGLTEVHRIKCDPFFYRFALSLLKLLESLSVAFEVSSFHLRKVMELG